MCCDHQWKLGRMLKRFKNHCSKKNDAHKWQLSSVPCTPINWPRWDSNKLDLYTNEEGIIELLVGSQQPLAKELAEYISIFIKKQVRFIPYRKFLREYQWNDWIDLYFPEHKLAIECDERDHKDRNINYEIGWQKFIEDQLNCRFICYNPDAKDFIIESVLNKIFQYIYQKRPLSWWRGTNFFYDPLMRS